MPTAQQQYQSIEARVLQYIDNRIINNPYFTQLKSGEMLFTTFQRSMGQYFHFRNSFHRWFGIAIANAPPVEDQWRPYVMNLASELAVTPQFGEKDHRLYCEDFLRAIGVDPQTVDPPNDATLHQINWFPQRYKEGDDHIGVLAALGLGNELHTGKRYEIIYEALRRIHNIPEEGLKFLTLHMEGIEDDHYDWIKEALISQTQEHAGHIENEARNSIDETARFWSALREMCGN